MFTLLSLTKTTHRTDKKNMGVFWSTITKTIILSGILLVTIPMNGCGKGKKIPGLENVNIGVLHKRLYASFTATHLTWDYGITVPIPYLYDSTFSVAPDFNSSGTVFQIAINIQSLLNNGKPFPLSGLPDGRKLPDVQKGALPRWDADIKGLRVSLYLADDAFGLFVPLELKNKHGISLPWLVSMKIMDERGNVLGKAYAIPSNVSGSGSGLFILLPYLG